MSSLRYTFITLLLTISGFTNGEAEPRVRKSHSILEVKSATHNRVKRALPASAYTQAEKDEILAKHNEFRKAAPSSNMQYMHWDDDLADMAQEWANRCNWKHGQPEENPSDWSFVGQNLWASTGRARYTTVAVIAWHAEINVYTYEKNLCAPFEQCGHYKQVVWADTTHVGCGIHTCIPSDGGDITHGDYIVCNYGPPGNYPRVPYLKGDTCSACLNGKFWCKDGMCDDCKGTDDCTCEAKCWNCATLNNDDCSCSCASGWRGNTCQDVCEDTNGRCGANPGWPVSWCNSGRSYVDDACFAMCGTCEVNADRAECGEGEGGSVSGGGALYPMTSLFLTSSFFISSFILSKIIH